MRSLLSIIIALIFILPSAQSQFGISAEFRSYPVVELESKIGHSIFDLNYGGSVDYWLRLKNYRWEMMPTISASYSSPKSVDNTLISQIGLFTGRFQFKNNFYLLDFKNDCNCPTFSKQNGWFKKSFYVQAAPAYAFNQYQLESADFVAANEIKHSFELGLGAGFDIGFSDLITLSPYFNYIISSRSDINLLSTLSDPFSSNFNHIVVGLRLGLRPDYARPSSMRRRNLRY